MSEPSRARSRSPSKGKSPTQYDESKLTKNTVLELKKMCTDSEIDITDVKLKQDIIARMLGRTNPPESASARSASARAAASERSDSPGRTASPHFTKTASAKRSPPKRQEIGGDDPESQLKEVREHLKHEWDVKTKKEGQPWTTLATLKSIFNREMMPSSPIASSSPTVVILVGPAASGKSSALERVRLGLTDENTVRVDPDRIYEWLAGKHGYFPPEIKEIKDPTQYDGESDAKYKVRCEKNRAKFTKIYADRLAWWLANKDTFADRYGREFEDAHVGTRGFEAAEFCTPKTAGVLGQYRAVLPSMEKMIFEGATKGRRLNVLLDTTGGMKEPFLEGMAGRFKAEGYKVVVVLVVSAENDCKARVSGPGGRNAQQHRKLDEDIVGQIWRGFVKDETPCRWERFSREQGTEFAVVQNTWTPSNPSGSARVVYRRNPDGRTDSLGHAELPHILGTYNVETDSKTGEFLCRGGGSASKGRGGSSRKRRISRRRIHGSRARKTIKKYSRPVTRRRRRHCRN
jgi:hypothetical protein